MSTQILKIENFLKFFQFHLIYLQIKFDQRKQTSENEERDYYRLDREKSLLQCSIKKRSSRFL